MIIKSIYPINIIIIDDMKVLLQTNDVYLLSHSRDVFSHTSYSP